jgi:hypothetical protein
MEALRLELAELPAAGRISLPAARAAAPAPKVGRVGRAPRLCLGIFYVAIVVYWCCNNVLDMLQPFVFRM